MDSDHSLLSFQQSREQVQYIHLPSPSLYTSGNTYKPYYTFYIEMKQIVVALYSRALTHIFRILLFIPCTHVTSPSFSNHLNYPAHLKKVPLVITVFQLASATTSCSTINLPPILVKRKKPITYL